MGGSMAMTTDRTQSISRLIINGLLLYRGFRLRSGGVLGIHSFLTPGKRRR